MLSSFSRLIFSLACSLAWLVGSTVAQTPSSSPLLETAQPLFAFVQASDSQVRTGADQTRFDNVMNEIQLAGTAGALLPQPIAFVIFPGDCTWEALPDEFDAFTTTLDTYLTANNIPYFCVPGNHDTVGGLANYNAFVSSDQPWRFGIHNFTGQNGLPGSTGWSGMTFIGFNNCYEASGYDLNIGGDHDIAPADLTRITNFVTFAESRQENIFFVCHRPFNDQSSVPLGNLLNSNFLCGVCRGHNSSVSVAEGLVDVATGIDNPHAWDLNSNSIVAASINGFLYYEVFRSGMRVWAVRLADNPQALGPADGMVRFVRPLQPL